ncbi:hypothetical protein BKA70DRAFT_116099 [Coprinopsis sp. MPI-PUGE-AT-0042]|nr:hypothetical protein BKA70DRAFT_116099 [Coprinopsis sp. MPI-PUGE-AT-0042]
MVRTPFYTIKIQAMLRCSFKSCSHIASLARHIPVYGIMMASFISAGPCPRCRPRRYCWLLEVDNDEGFARSHIWTSRPNAGLRSPWSENRLFTWPSSSRHSQECFRSAIRLHISSTTSPMVTFLHLCLCRNPTLCMNTPAVSFHQSNGTTAFHQRSLSNPIWIRKLSTRRSHIRCFGKGKLWLKTLCGFATIHTGDYHGTRPIDRENTL